MARKAAWEDAVDSDLRPYGKSSGTNWGRLLTGLLVVASATFFAAYYLPLYRAQQKLTDRNRELSQKSQGMADAASKAQADLKSVTALRDQLQAEHDQREGTKRAAGDQQEHLRAELASKLDKFVKKGNAAVASSGGSVLVALDGAMLFAPQKVDLSVPARGILCDIVKSSGSASLRVSETMPATATMPASLEARYPGLLALSAARAAAIAQALEDRCSVPTAQLSATGYGKRDPFVGQLSNTKPSGERGVLEISSRLSELQTTTAAH